MLLALAAPLCLACGFFIVANAWPRCAWGADLPLCLSLSTGFGLGLFSAVFFCSCMLGSNHLIAIDLSAGGALVAALLFRRTRAETIQETRYASEILDLPSWLQRVLNAAFVLALVVAFYSAIRRTMAHPHGDGWDAFAIWNLHARFLFRGEAHWRDGFSALIPWSHPDYPLLLPASIAHFWTYLGHDNPIIPMIIGQVFAVGTIGVFYSALGKLRGRNVAILASLALVSTPFFVEQSAAQYADIPLSFFFLSTVALLTLHSQKASESGGLLALAGLSAGFAAWTKNEGQLFLAATLVALLVASGHKRENEPEKGGSFATNWKNAAIFFAGALPILALLFWFKHAIAPPGDLFSSPSSMLARILMPARYWAILRWYAKEFFRFGDWWIVPGTVLLAVLYFATTNRASGVRNPVFRNLFWPLVLTLAGYLAIYVITPYDIYWHLRFSLSRLFLQIWPAALFLFFSSVSFRFAESVSK